VCATVHNYSVVGSLLKRDSDCGGLIMIDMLRLCWLNPLFCVLAELGAFVIAGIPC